MSTEVSKQEAKPAPLSPIQVFENQLANYKPSIKSLLSTHGMSIDEFMVTALNAVKKVPELINADRKTLLGAVLTSAELGLPPNTPMQLSFILPYKRKSKNDQGQWVSVTEAQFQIGYIGWVEIMLRNPKVESIDSGIVYANEKWYYNKGLRDPFSHEPLPPKERGEAIGAYAIAWIKDSIKPKVVFLYKEELDDFKKISKAGDSEHSPWNSVEKDPQRWMWRKTCLKQLSKELPKTKELQKAYVQDNAVEMGGSQTVTEEGYVEIIENPEVVAEERVAKKEAKDEAVAKNAKNLFDKKD